MDAADRGSILQCFAFDHMPPETLEITRRYHELAHWLHTTLPHNAQSYMSLQKLLESRDCSVRAALFKW